MPLLAATYAIDFALAVRERSLGISGSVYNIVKLRSTVYYQHALDCEKSGLKSAVLKGILR